MEQSSEYREQLLESYKQAVRPLLPYLPWLEQSAGKRASSIYSGQDIGVNSVSFPVYDGTLLNFVREATKSPLMDRNYAYVYTRHWIRTHQEERDIIQKAGWKEWDILRGILSKYVLGGRTKGNLWSEAVSEQQDGDVVLIRQERADKNLFPIKKVPGGQTLALFCMYYTRSAIV